MRHRAGLIAALLTVLTTLGCSAGPTQAPVPSSSNPPTSQSTSTAPVSTRPTLTPPTSTWPTSTSPTSTSPTSTSRPSPTASASSTSTSIPSATPTVTTTPTVPRTPTATATTRPATAACATTGRHSGADLTTLPTTEKVVALTFDAGANGDAVPSILATLKAKNAVGTFFLTGAFVRAYPDLARRIAAAYPVGNHTDTHPDLTKLSNSAVVDQIRRGALAIESVTGTSTAPLFRFPFGAVDARVIRLVNQECYVPFRWTVDTLGWMGTSGGITAAGITAKVLANARPGEIVLMHVGSNPNDRSTLDAAALPSMIDGLRARGYRFVTIPQILT